MYKGHKISKRIQRYMGYAKVKYHKLSVKGEVDLWAVLNEYEFILEEPTCVQMYIYDQIKGRVVYGECYEIINWVNGGVYVREVFEYSDKKESRLLAYSL